MKFKRNMYVVIIAIVIYFTLSFIYNNFITKDDFKYVYLLDKKVSRGDMVLESDFVKMKISGDYSNKYLSEFTSDKVYSDDYMPGYIISNEMLISNEEYIQIDSDKELVSIKFDFSEDAASYQVEKGSVVNIFYSAKLFDVSEIINSINKENIISNKLDNSYVTVKLLEKVKIKNCYDKFGKVAINSGVIETVLIEVSKEDSIMINNLKNYGKFSISIIK